MIRTRTTRIRTLIGTGVLGLLLALVPIGAVSQASAANVVSQCNATDNAAAAQVECRVDIANTLDLAGSSESSIVTVSQCFGAPAAAICTPPVTTSYSTLTLSVDQCNGSGNKGGSTVICSVAIVNTIIGAASATPATVNQCAGSGAGGGELSLLCDSYDTTTGATVTQCNGSVNGGGAPGRVICSVGPSTVSSAIPVTVNQCNGTANGGGARLICSVSISNLGLDVEYTGPDLGTVRPTPTPGAGPVVPIVDGGTGGPTPPASTDGGGGGGAGTADTPGTPPELADTGFDASLPLLGSSLALAFGGALSLSTLLRRRKSRA